MSNEAETKLELTIRSESRLNGGDAVCAFIGKDGTELLKAENKPAAHRLIDGIAAQKLADEDTIARWRRKVDRWRPD